MGEIMKSEVIVTEDELPGDVIAAIEQGHKIEAIKLLRQVTGLGLANAKVLVDQAARTHGPKRQVLSFADKPQIPRGLVKSLGLVLLLAAAWHFYQG
jgi:ribosomal L7/L12-like protein